MSKNIPGNDVESSPWQLKYHAVGMKKSNLPFWNWAAPQ